MAKACRVFTEKCVRGIKANEEQCLRYAELTGQLVTAIAPVVGYDRAAEIYKKALKQNVSIREILEQDAILPRDEIARLLDLRKLADGGRAGGAK
jgi:aspartate ammonia-lyase